MYSLLTKRNRSRKTNSAGTNGIGGRDGRRLATTPTEEASVKITAEQPALLTI